MDDIRKALAALSSAKPTPVLYDGIPAVFAKKVRLSEYDFSTEEKATDEDANAKKQHDTAKMACRVLCTADGRLVYDVNDPKQVEEVKAFPLDLILAIMKAAGGNKEEKN